jgi:hypothetical protein
LDLSGSPRKPRFIAVGFPWISLDSLVRIKTYQWVIEHKRAKIFSLRFVRADRHWNAKVEAVRKREIVMS